MSFEVSAYRATAHPLRVRMLSLLTGAELSATELARELDITQANASYHLRQLAAAGLVQEAGQQNIRGGIAKRYRYAGGFGRTDEDEPADREERFFAWQAVAHELIRRAQSQTAEADAVSRLCDTEVWIEPGTLARIDDLIVKATNLLHRGARPARTPGTVHVAATLALFEMEEPAERAES